MFIGRLRLVVFAELMVQTVMTVAPPRVCVLMAGLSWVPWLLMHHRCAAPPSQSPISLTQARWGCKPAINSTHSTYIRFPNPGCCEWVEWCCSCCGVSSWFLSDTVKDGLASAGCPSDLEPLISHTMRLDNHLISGTSQSYPVTPGQFWSPVPPPLGNPEPMQIGRTHITAAEQKRRRREKCCIYCGKPGHFRATCPELLGKDQARPAEGGFWQAPLFLPSFLVRGSTCPFPSPGGSSLTPARPW